MDPSLSRFGKQTAWVLEMVRGGEHSCPLLIGSVCGLSWRILLMGECFQLFFTYYRVECVALLAGVEVKALEKRISSYKRRRQTLDNVFKFSYLSAEVRVVMLFSNFE